MRNKQISINDALKTAKAMGDLSRLRVVAALFSHKELCVCQITGLLGFAPSTVSRHIRLLEEASLVLSRKDGRWVHYRLSPDIPEELKNWLMKYALKSVEAEADMNKLKKIIAEGPSELCKE